MKKFKFIMCPCVRCNKNFSILSKFIYGKEMQPIFDEYRNVCPECLTENEIMYIWQMQYDVIINNISGGTGAGFGIEVMKDLKKYLKSKNL